MDTKERMYIVLQKRDVSQSELAKKLEQQGRQSIVIFMADIKCGWKPLF